MISGKIFAFGLSYAYCIFVVGKCRKNKTHKDFYVLNERVHSIFRYCMCCVHVSASFIPRRKVKIVQKYFVDVSGFLAKVDEVGDNNILFSLFCFVETSFVETSSSVWIVYHCSTSFLFTEQLFLYAIFLEIFEYPLKYNNKYIVKQYTSFF